MASPAVIVMAIAQLFCAIVCDHGLWRGFGPPSKRLVAREDGDPPTDMPNPGKITWPAKGPGGPWHYSQYTYRCGQMATGNRADLNKGAYVLGLDNLTFPLGLWKSENECNRAFGWATSGIYVCTENHNETQSVDGTHIGWMAGSLLRLCCWNIFGQSGQIWHPTANWTVIVGYANNNDPPNTVPWKYGENGQGNNPQCRAAPEADGGDGDGHAQGTPFGKRKTRLCSEEVDA